MRRRVPCCAARSTGARRDRCHSWLRHDWPGRPAGGPSHRRAHHCLRSQRCQARGRPPTGAEATINASATDWRQQLAALAPDGPDLVIEAVGAAATFLQAVDIAASCGRVVYIGYAKDAIAYDTKQFITKELDIRGSRNALAEDFANVVEFLSAHPGTGRHVVSREVSLAEAPDVLAEWNARPADFTKILVAV